MPRSLDDRDDTPIRRTSRKRGFWNPISISLVGGGGVLVLALVAFLLVRGGKGPAVTGGGPNPGDGRVPILPALGGFGEDPRETWTHKELTAFLNEKGLGIEQRDATSALTQTVAVRYTSPRYPKKKVTGRETDHELWEQVEEESGVVCEKVTSSEAARDLAAAKGGKAFSWGRFVFSKGPSGLLDDIRRATASR